MDGQQSNLVESETMQSKIEAEPSKVMDERPRAARVLFI
jgi:hypothetical protein